MKLRSLHTICLVTALLASALAAGSGCGRYSTEELRSSTPPQIDESRHYTKPVGWRAKGRWGIAVGAVFLLACDTLAQRLLPVEELPVGVITAMLGGPFFVFLLLRRRGAALWMD